MSEAKNNLCQEISHGVKTNRQEIISTFLNPVLKRTFDNALKYSLKLSTRIISVFSELYKPIF